ncbi:hypothetical protein [Pseudomonas alkylphenolica]|uniref:hypothetical protein n=1 Tax=Pseudomonas alkylphenolica TaxID=237609 RepID=UPI00315D57F2
MSIHKTLEVKEILHQPITQEAAGLEKVLTLKDLRAVQKKGDLYTQSFFEKILGFLGISKIGEMKEELGKLFYGKTPADRIDGFFGVKELAEEGSKQDFTLDADTQSITLRILNNGVGLVVKIDFNSQHDYADYFHSTHRKSRSYQDSVALLNFGGTPHTKDSFNQAFAGSDILTTERTATITIKSNSPATLPPHRLT